MEFFHISIGAGSGSTSYLTNILSGIAVALGGGITLFLLNWLREYLTAKWKRKDEAAALAFSLVTHLDRVVQECADVVGDPLYEDPETSCWRSTVSTPTVNFSDTINWTVFPRMLQYKVRSIPNKIGAADRAVAEVYENGEGPPDYSDAFSERTLRYAWIGLECVLLLEELAAAYKVPQLDRGKWDPKASFMHHIGQEGRRRAELDGIWPSVIPGPSA